MHSSSPRPLRVAGVRLLSIVWLNLLVSGAAAQPPGLPPGPPPGAPRPPGGMETPPMPPPPPECPPPADPSAYESTEPADFEAFGLPDPLQIFDSKHHRRAEWHASLRSHAAGIPINPIGEIAEQLHLLEERGMPFAGDYYPGEWRPLGPVDFVPGTELTNNMGGLGRINVLAFDPVKPGRIFAGTAAGGLWRTESYGESWQLATRDPRLMAISGLAIDPVDTQTVYALTGDGNASIAVVPTRPSIGVLKSVDGGRTWRMSGLDWRDQSQRYGFTLSIDPGNRCVLFAATNKGIYRTPDAGAHWKRVQQGNFRDLELKPGDASVAYASTTTEVYRSTDHGETWNPVQIDVAWAQGDDPEYRRVALGVSPASPETVYALFGGTSGLVGIYRSDNSGATFDAKATAPNVLGYSSYGGDNSSVAFYALTLGVSPIDVDEVYLGAVDIWKSIDGASNWTLSTYWKNEPHYFPYVHADTHQLTFQKVPPGLVAGTADLGPNGESYALFSANDGGLAISFDHGESWAHRSQGLNITQAYRVCGTPSDLDLVYFGSQDNGSSRLDLATATAYATFRGDGMECHVDPENTDTVYFSQGNGVLFRSRDGGETGISITPPVGTGSGAWLTPFILHPTEPDTVYACYTDLWMSPDQGTTWTNVTSGAIGKDTCVDLAISPAEPDRIWIAKGTKVYHSRKDTTKWANVTRNLPVGSTSITSISVSPADPHRAWVTLGGYSERLKIYGTDDDGQLWENLSRNLLNLPANTVISHAAAAPDGQIEHDLFLGTDIGVFLSSDRLCREQQLCDWLPFFQGMNPLIVLDLELYPEARLLRAATFAQGIWETSLPQLPEP